MIKIFNTDIIVRKRLLQRIMTQTKHSAPCTRNLHFIHFIHSRDIKATKYVQMMKHWIRCLQLSRKIALIFRSHIVICPFYKIGVKYTLFFAQMRESVQNEVNECDVYNFRLFFKRTRDVNITTLSLVSTSAE